MNHARRGYSGSRIYHAADDTVRIDLLGKNARRIKALQMVVCIFAVKFLKVPPRQTVLYSQHDSIGAKHEIVTGQVAQPQRAEIARLKTPARLVELGRGLRLTRSSSGKPP